MIKISLIGCTGSIGKQTAEIVRKHKEEFCFTALACGRNAEGLTALCSEFRPSVADCKTEDVSLPSGVKKAHSAEELFTDCDVALIAAGGFEGLSYTLSAIRAGKKVALANKESLVCGGEIVLAEAKKYGVELVPVDSEHSAIFQALSFRRDTVFSKLVLTASGGPFLHCSKEQIARVTAKDALKHPTWSMGAKITIDSATLLNKGYEIIEAKWLYGAEYSQIEAVVHPESIVHSLVYFADGAAVAQLGYPDMRVPIQLALTYPQRLACCEFLDLEKIGVLHFERLPKEKFPCFALALGAGEAGGTCPTVLNGAAEIAVRAFLEGRISFPQIAETIEDALNRIPKEAADSYGSLAAADRLARDTARKFIYG
ncbi:MAG: 1-deoxy-D-xylulose-5-phosphate reductoisomerase [Clostridia bacterium]|nr:1-deoxy-D-xylulose-5-phosphate reductoisomerase [Clostridia bacterium]